VSLIFSSATEAVCYTTDVTIIIVFSSVTKAVCSTKDDIVTYTCLNDDDVFSKACSLMALLNIRLTLASL
jgi:hypothetical protein